MQVYGDIERIEDAARVAAEIEDQLTYYKSLGAGLLRHQGLVSAFIRAGELLQGIADAEFTLVGADDISDMQEAGGALLVNLARAIKTSWESEFFLPPGWGQSREQLALLATAGNIRTRTAEGYAFYAVYPEAYCAAARRSGLGPDTMVIGIRSIGTGLAAIVAATLNSAATCTVRPVGHPFARHLNIGGVLAQRLRSATANYAIVDEGPGLSGSSINCVADWLVSRGVSEDRIHFFPSHGGDLGSKATDAHLRRWSTAKKHVETFEQLIVTAQSPHHRLEQWIADSVGPLSAPLEDLSGGAWRILRDQSTAMWPPATPSMEKRKYLAQYDGKYWLAKYTGLGASGEAKLLLARTLAEHHFAPEPVAICHGFLVMPWAPEVPTQSLRISDERLIDYLELRASLPPPGLGATLPKLFAMAIYNIGQYWGEPASVAMEKALGDPQRFQTVPCCTDNRMHRWEWISQAGGWIKADGLDHHAAHDLVGCQDIAWDLAGATVEIDLSATSRDAIATQLGARIRRQMSRDFIVAHELCYIAFQIGLWTMALNSADDAERYRIGHTLKRYDQKLFSTLAATVGS